MNTVSMSGLSGITNNLQGIGSKIAQKINAKFAFANPKRFVDRISRILQSVPLTPAIKRAIQRGRALLQSIFPDNKTILQKIGGSSKFHAICLMLFLTFGTSAHKSFANSDNMTRTKKQTVERSVENTGAIIENDAIMTDDSKTLLLSLLSENGGLDQDSDDKDILDGGDDTFLDDVTELENIHAQMIEQMGGLDVNQFSPEQIKSLIIMVNHIVAQSQDVVGESKNPEISAFISTIQDFIVGLETEGSQDLQDNVNILPVSQTEVVAMQQKIAQLQNTINTMQGLSQVDKQNITLHLINSGELLEEHATLLSKYHFEQIALGISLALISLLMCLLVQSKFKHMRENAAVIARDHTIDQLRGDQEILANKVYDAVQKYKQKVMQDEKLSSAISHGILATLAKIEGLVQIIGFDADLFSPEVREYLAIIETEVGEGRDIIDALTIILENENLLSKNEITDVSGFVQNIGNNVIKYMESKVPGWNKNVDIDTNNIDIGTIYTDEKMIEELLFRLIHNSVIYAGQNTDYIEIKVDIGYIGDTDAEKKLQFTIIDNGPGIDPNQIHLATQMNKRCQADKLPSQGTGQGLAVVSSIVDKMKGDLLIKNNDICGLIVQATIPASQFVAPSKNSQSKTDKRFSGFTRHGYKSVA